jgi:hypothetical protein
VALYQRTDLKVAVAALLSLFSAGCVSGMREVPYRSVIRTEANLPECNAERYAQNHSAREPSSSSSLTWQNCALQSHTVKVEGQDLTFDLGFLEFNQTGNLIDRRQLASIEEQLKSNSVGENAKTNFIIIFVHGWRNDASIGRTDSAKFRTVMGYLTSFIHQRCQIQNCSPAVTGIYVGWPGRAVTEPSIPGLDLVIAALTFKRAKDIGDDIGPNVTSQLTSLLERVRTNDQAGRETKILIVGHSAGANLLMSGLVGDGLSSQSSPVLRELERYNQARRQTQSNVEPSLLPVNKSPLGDFVVLINPASSARRWVALQQNSFFDQVTGAITTDVAQNSNFIPFPIQQRPTLLAITSACEQSVDKVGRRPDLFRECDLATRYAFSASQFLQSGQSNVLDNRALTVYDLKDQSANTTVTNQRPITPGLRLQTNLASLAQENTRASVCESNHAWLAPSRRRRSDGEPDPFWDSQRTAIVRGTLNGAGPNEALSKLTMQSRFGVLIRMRKQVGKSNTPPVRANVDSNSPFWNARASSTSQLSHGGYVSYPLLCHITQLWLDPVDQAPMAATLSGQ